MADTGTVTAVDVRADSDEGLVGWGMPDGIGRGVSSLSQATMPLLGADVQELSIETAHVSPDIVQVKIAPQTARWHIPDYLFEPRTAKGASLAPLRLIAWYHRAEELGSSLIVTRHGSVRDFREAEDGLPGPL